LAPLTKNNIVSFNNLGIFTPGNSEEIYKSDPTDGKLELVISGDGGKINKKSQPTIVSFETLRVDCAEPGAFIIIDQVTKLKPPATITIAPEKLKVIVGSKRLF
jgi:hypothetical protein